MRVKKHKDEAKEWQVSYIDLLTAMIAAFTLLLSMSKPDQAKLDMYSSSVDKAQKIQENLNTLAAELEKNIKNDSTLTDQINVVLTDNGVEVRFYTGLLFPVGKAKLQSGGYEAIKKLSPRLKQFAVARNALISIEGHTDDQPIIGGKEFMSNWELSTARAAEVLHFLEDSMQFETRWLSATGFADSRPQNTEKDPVTGTFSEQARAQNRRVVIRIYYRDIE